MFAVLVILVIIVIFVAFSSFVVIALIAIAFVARVGDSYCWCVYLHSPDIIVVDVVVVRSHKHDVDHNAEGDEQLRERVEDNIGTELRRLDPDVATIPDAQDICRVHPLLDEHGFHLLALVFFIVVVVVEVVVEAATAASTRDGARVESTEGARLAQGTLGHLIDNVVKHADILQNKVQAQLHSCRQLGDRVNQALFLFNYSVGFQHRQINKKPGY